MSDVPRSVPFSLLLWVHVGKILLTAGASDSDDPGSAARNCGSRCSQVARYCVLSTRSSFWYFLLTYTRQFVFGCHFTADAAEPCAVGSIFEPELSLLQSTYSMSGLLGCSRKRITQDEFWAEHVITNRALACLLSQTLSTDIGAMFLNWLHNTGSLDSALAPWVFAASPLAENCSLSSDQLHEGLWAFVSIGLNQQQASIVSIKHICCLTKRLRDCCTFELWTRMMSKTPKMSPFFQELEAGLEGRNWNKFQDHTSNITRSVLCDSGPLVSPPL